MGYLASSFSNQRSPIPAGFRPFDMWNFVVSPPACMWITLASWSSGPIHTTSYPSVDTAAAIDATKVVLPHLPGACTKEISLAAANAWDHRLGDLRLRRLVLEAQIVAVLISAGGLKLGGVPCDDGPRSAACAAARRRCRAQRRTMPAELATLVDLGIQRAIEAIEGDVPPTAGRGRKKAVKAVGRRKRAMSEEQRRAVAERMRKYWAARREAKAQEEAAQE